MVERAHRDHSNKASRRLVHHQAPGSSGCRVSAEQDGRASIVGRIVCFVSAKGAQGLSCDVFYTD
jgi:hypothetical protein